MHRITLWLDDDGAARRVSVACATDAWELVAEATEDLGPFDCWQDELKRLMARQHLTPAVFAHQGELQFG